MQHSNHYPLWKNILLVIIALLALLYAIPNFYGEAPAIEISSSEGNAIKNSTIESQTLD
ncbi:hypothetical protein FJ364_05400, partial [Candidatus Dependentiae bacterium]|nr:hypothetical protein [Candidatus Dependentiae bacterium]